MTSREFFVATVKDELPRFERLLKALPAKKTNYTPHPKSRDAKGIIAIIGNESAQFLEFLKKGFIDYAKYKEKNFKSISEALKFFITNMNKVLNITSKMTEKQWDSKAQMLVGSHVEWETNKGNMAWGLMLDLIHHRGQLSTYIRPMGGKVPSIYGPSGDSK